jgi:hypothetical protein
MNKRKFFSFKYQKYNPPDNKDFWNITRDEAVYLLQENKKMNCSSIEHMEEREKLGKMLGNFQSNG